MKFLQKLTLLLHSFDSYEEFPIEKTTHEIYRELTASNPRPKIAEISIDPWVDTQFRKIIETIYSKQLNPFDMSFLFILAKIGDLLQQIFSSKIKSMPRLESLINKTNKLRLIFSIIYSTVFGLNFIVKEILESKMFTKHKLKKLVLKRKEATKFKLTTSHIWASDFCREINANLANIENKEWDSIRASDLLN